MSEQHKPPSAALYRQDLFTTVNVQLQCHYHKNSGSRDTLEIQSYTIYTTLSAACKNSGKVIKLWTLLFLFLCSEKFDGRLSRLISICHFSA